MQPKPVRPPRLGRGARVALLAPSGPVSAADRAAAVAHCHELGFEPVLMPHADRAHGYLAGRDTERLADLNAALADPSIDGIWCLRGGTGMTRILADVDFAALARRPIPIIGYSDITALLSAVWTETGIVSFHGPIARAALPEFSRAQLQRVTGAPEPPGRLDLPATDPETPVTLHPGRARGRLIGGNLSLLQTLVGTRWFPDLRGAILFLEDVHEPVYRIDRMLSHLRLAGLLEGIAGVALGRFTDRPSAPEGADLDLHAVVQEYFAPLDVPVAAGFPIGHIEAQWTLPVGILAELDADSPTLALLEGAVR